MRNLRIVTDLGAIALILLLACCSSSPTETPPLRLLAGTWQEAFSMPDIGIVDIAELLADDSSSMPMRTVVATLILGDGEFTSAVDKPALPLPSYHTPPPISGSYQVHGDTITFSESGGAEREQRFRLRLERDRLHLAYLGETDTLASGDTVINIPLGCLPWRNAWMKHNGVFERVGRPNRK
jgi:hypothetical protein